MNHTVVDYVNAAVTTHPDKVFLYQGEEQMIFREIDEQSDRLASALLDIGIEKGDHLAINALNQFEWLVSFFASAKLGATLVTLNVRYRDSEIEYMVNNAEVKAIISIDSFAGFDYVAFYQNLRDKLPTVEHYLFIGGGGFEGSYDVADLLQVEVNKKRLEQTKQQVKATDPLLIIYTSGTTGKPKGSMITHKSILASAIAQRDHFHVGEEDLAIGALPLNHVGGITCTVMVALVSQSSVTLIPFFQPQQVLQAIQEYKATILGGVPTMYLMLMNEKDLAHYNLSSLRLCIAGGSNVEPKLALTLSKQLPNATLVNLYGLSETSGACVLSNLHDSVETISNSIGVVIGDFQGKVVDTEGREVPNGDVGELVIKGDCVAQGYYQMPNETAETFSSDGWLQTGDMVTKDASSYISYKGRKKEMYITGGFNVFPVEIENILTTHDKVQLAAGIGIPDEFLGEVGRFYIVPAADTNPTEEELREFCLSHVSDYKIPKEFIFVSDVPMTPAGKIQKAKLKENGATNPQNS
ncbi:AMP-binding protein [Pontibacillus yanchengensis]|uniref:AMP-binding protein n=2 Tax=Pontibacillus yanchengensis TaxID=462910 RepID=A0ACC7VBC5_9BACI|nr:AMP-binding protein [Pontibacillus yanchengensis]MYL52663.1 AMP-binding protein [Pontibacillus yanchengensis]